MKAIHCTAYGTPEVLQLKETDKPKPAEGEILIRIAATSITSGDCEMRTSTMHPTMYLFFRLFLGLTKPRKPILGMYFSGTVEQLGSEVTRFSIGQDVFGTTGFTMGTNAEYVSVPAKNSIISKPPSVSHLDAAATPIGAWNALHFMKLAKLQAAESILIFGAGGAIGTFAIQLAKMAGATVTAVDSAAKLSMLTETGADHVIDYEKEDFTEAENQYDVIFDVVGKSPYAKSLRRLNPGGRYILANVGFTPMLRGFWTTKTSDKTVISAMAKETQKELEEISKMLVNGVLHPVVDRTFTLEEIPDAHRYLDSGKRKGNIVAEIESSVVQ
ncbi:MAG: NAD(P)-dependent alcohol dehydrogenase [Pseudohongiellaceae bacterium]